MIVFHAPLRLLQNEGSTCFWVKFQAFYRLFGVDTKLINDLCLNVTEEDSDLGNLIMDLMTNDFFLRNDNLRVIKTKNLNIFSMHHELDFREAFSPIVELSPVEDEGKELFVCIKLLFIRPWMYV